MKCCDNTSELTAMLFIDLSDPTQGPDLVNVSCPIKMVELTPAMPILCQEDE